MTALGAGTNLAFERPAWLLLLLATPALFVLLRRSLAEIKGAILAKLRLASRNLMLKLAWRVILRSVPVAPKSNFTQS